jgi:hypothetical protein
MDVWNDKMEGWGGWVRLRDGKMGWMGCTYRCKNVSLVELIDGRMGWIVG